MEIKFKTWPKFKALVITGKAVSGEQSASTALSEWENTYKGDAKEVS